jgi:hypothetical protein
MSHGNERKEKVCLNCNARVFGPYCHVCGQHNIETKETALGLVVHFFNDITHFEGKFIASLRYLLFRPGFLTTEYERGRRASYMNPVRMYVFASAFFFILFFSFFSGDEKSVVKVNQTNDSIKVKQPALNFNSEFLKDQALKDARTREDSIQVIEAFGTKEEKQAVAKDSGRVTGILGIAGEEFKTIAAYDSIQAQLPKEKRDKWLERLFKKRIIIINERFNGDLKAFNAAVYDYSIHALPKILFISLPLFAFMLFLLYVRHKRFLYVTHIIFTIHLYVFYFIMLLLLFSNGKISEFLNWWPGNLLNFAVWLYMFFYLYKAMRRVYEQHRAKTVFKYFILLFFTMILFVLLIAGLFSYTIFNV